MTRIVDIFCNWKRYFSTNPEIPSCILSQYLWFNKFIIVDNSYVNFTNFSTKKINFVRDLVNENCNFKSRETLKNEYHLDKRLYFEWMQLIHAIPLIWEQKINDSEKNVERSYVVQDHHLIKNTRAVVLGKLTAREIYSVLLLSSGNIPTFQKYFDNVFQNEIFDWKKMYILPRVVTTNRLQRNFQYKILHDILYLNKIRADIRSIKSVNRRTFHSTDISICVYKMLQISVHWGTVIINIEGSIIPSV